MKKALRTALFVAVVCSLLPEAQPAAAATKATLIKLTLTSSWPTKSPDPMGLTYNPRTRKLLISDAEVDEMPALWKGKNLFVAKRGGPLVATGTFKKFTHEPEDLAWDNQHQALFVTDDDLDRVFRVGRGKDRRLGTRDDIVKSFGTHKYGFTTAEDVAIRGKHLFIVSSRQRFILETTLKGGLVQTIDLRGIRDSSGQPIRSASGIAFAPGTDGGRSRLYLTDSGVDNNVDPNENDGRLFELKLVKTP